MCSDGGNKNDVKELLEWELSLDSRDLRAHAWYHGNITRQTAESLLQNDGDFLVRDCSSSTNPGDFVLSCRWRNNNLHFLVHRDILQKNTIYEQLRYRFEFESFDTVSDLITYHVGSGMPISTGSGVLINSPKNRDLPITRGGKEVNHGSKGDYVTLQTNGTPEPIPVFSYLNKVSTLERLKQTVPLKLDPPPGLLEDLEEIPPHIQDICRKFMDEGRPDIHKGSSFDLESFESILLPTCKEDVRMDASLLNTILNLLLETDESVLALHITKLDWEILTNNSEDNFHPPRGLYQLCFHDSQHRWDNIIERSLTLSHFVVITITHSTKPEEMLNKWMAISGELKISFGNFFSFCSIMRGLLMPVITRVDGKINWMKLRSEYTDSTFTFETSYRTTFQSLATGTAEYPPNTGIPELLSGALILEDSLELLPISCIAGEEDQLKFITTHLTNLRNLASWKNIQKRNIERHFAETFIELDILLTDLFKTELQLLLVWGKSYNETSIKCRSETFCNLN